MTYPFKTTQVDIDDYKPSMLENVAEIDWDDLHGTVSIEITEPCTLIVNTSEWTQVYRLIKKGAENDLPV